MWTRFLGFVMAVTLMAAGPAFAGSTGQSAGAATQAAAKQVDINSASLAELTTLPGIGPKTAERILEYRQKAGGFEKIEELMNVRGIGEKNFLRLKPLITASPMKGDGRAGSGR